LTLECGASEEILFKNVQQLSSARIDASGRLLVGTSSALDASAGRQLQVADANGAYLILGRDDTSVGDGPGLGGIHFYGNDTTSNAWTKLGSIDCSSDGTQGAGDNPTRLVFSTTADGASSPTERLRIDSSGNVGIGTTNPSQKLEVSGNTSIIGGGFLLMQNTNRIQWGSSGTAYIAGQDGGSGYLALGTVGSERARIDASGRLLIGTSTARANLFNSTIAPAIQLEGAGIVPAQRFLSVINNYATAGDGGGVIVLGRSKGGTVGSNTVVAADDQLGRFDFQGNDGTDFVPGATIQGFVDGTPGANDMPGRLVFSTTADGASTPTGRMRISSEGRTDAFGTSETLRVRTAATTAAASIAIRLQAGATSITAGGTTEFQVTSNGNVANTTNSYGAISDIKLKENIVDANSQWNDLKALQVRNYNFKEGQTHTQIGLVAQEAELVSPGLVNESPDHDAEGNDLGTVTKSQGYQADPSDPGFVSYDNLTQAICIGWVQDSLGSEGVASLESGLSANLDEQENPTEAAGVPWATTMDISTADLG
jgi:hypothetical protein